jgi:FkbH-like protein
VAAPSLLARLRELKKANRFAELRAAIARGARDLDAVEQAEAVGHLLRDVPAAALVDAGGVPLPQLRIGVVSGFGAGPIANPLRAHMVRAGIWPSIFVGGFNEYAAELLDGGSALYAGDPELVLCLWDEQLFFEGLPASPRPDELERAVDDKLAFVRSLASAFVQRSRATLVLTTVPLSAVRHHTTIDYRTKARLSRIWREANAALLEIAEEQSQVVVLDLDPLLGEGIPLRDERLAGRAGQHLSPPLLDRVAIELTKLAAALLGRAKKCLVLDLDDTLWGGVLGDVGPEGLALGRDADGRPFLDLQRTAKALRQQGVLLAISSKNDEARVLDVLRHHPDMILRDDDFAEVRAGWEPKSESLRALAADLDLDPGAFVFLDDSAFERDQVAGALPMVGVVDVPDDPALYASALVSRGDFNVLATTAEDAQRTSFYRGHVARARLERAAGSYEQFLSGLNLEIALVPPSALRLPRLVQLGQRTNQFNLAARRYQAGDIEAMARGGRHLIYGIEGRDRCGDYGLVGAVLIDRASGGREASEGGPAAGDEWWIRNFLLSCRVFSRGIERAVLREILLRARAQRAAAVFAEYVASDKNQRFKGFYEDNGFAPVLQDAARATFRHDLERLPEPVSWIQLSVETEEMAA